MTTELPDGSPTLPVMVAVSTCAKAAAAVQNRNMARDEMIQFIRIVRPRRRHPPRTSSAGVGASIHPKNLDHQHYGDARLPAAAVLPPSPSARGHPGTFRRGQLPRRSSRGLARRYRALRLSQSGEKRSAQLVRPMGEGSTLRPRSIISSSKSRNVRQYRKYQRTMTFILNWRHWNRARRLFRIGLPYQIGSSGSFAKHPFAGPEITSWEPAYLKRCL